MGISTDHTRRRLSLGARDTVTGWRNKEWTETTIQGLLFNRASSSLATKAGLFVRLDALFVSCDGVVEGDQIKTSDNQYYEVKSVREHWIGDSFMYRSCDLTLLPMQVDIAVATYAGTFRTEDPRYRTKVYIETYWTAGNAQDDLGNALGVQVMYAEPDYPLTWELKAPSAVDVVIALGKAETKPLRQGDLSTYGYDENVPITICAVDKTNTTAVKAVWQCECELRKILEDHPQGSVRNLDHTRDDTKNFGSTVLHSSVYQLSYRRGVS